MGCLDGKKVAFIDDEIAITRPYRDRLMAEGATLEVFEYISEMLEFVDGGGLGEIDAIVADLQMPRPDAVNDADFIETGSLSGLWLLKQIKVRVVAEHVAVVVLTNVGEPRYRDHLRGLEYPSKHIAAYQKMELAAIRLPQVVAERIQTATR